MNAANMWWAALLAAIGTGSIVGSLIGRWGTISNLRQNWIDGLRNDLAELFSEIEIMHVELLNTDHTKNQKSALLAYRRILLRLNIKEDLHIRLADQLHKLLTIGDAEADRKRIDDAVSLARQILKQEWEVVKFSKFFAKYVATYKRLQPTEEGTTVASQK